MFHRIWIQFDLSNPPWWQTYVHSHQLFIHVNMDEVKRKIVTDNFQVSCHREKWNESQSSTYPLLPSRCVQRERERYLSPPYRITRDLFCIHRCFRSYSAVLTYKHHKNRRRRRRKSPRKTPRLSSFTSRKIRLNESCNRWLYWRCHSPFFSFI